MQRRKFVKQSSLVLLASSIPGWVEASRYRIKKANTNKKILIIGAGAAGLYAGFTCKQEGIDFQILEASDKIGGRLGKLEGFADFPIDLGAQWLHGKKSILGKLIRSTNTAISKDQSGTSFWFKNRLTESTPMEDLYGALEGDDSFPDVSFIAYAQKKGFGGEYKYLVEQVAGDLGADATDISVKWLAVEEEGWSSGNADYKFEKTFFDLINDHIANDLIDKIKLNAIVDSIDYSGDTIVVSDKSGENYDADKVIITVPITILQEGDISFNPPLPKEKVDAFNKIGMGPGMKVWLKFDERFYHGNIAGGSVCAAYADEIEGKNGDDNVLLAFAMGHQAQNLTDLGSDKAITQALLGELDEMYNGRASESFIDSFVQDWTSKPFIRGAYSYSKVGIGASRKIAAKPVDSKIYFAGEAMNLNGHHQTVHGAAETGVEQVNEILKA